MHAIDYSEKNCGVARNIIKKIFQIICFNFTLGVFMCTVVSRETQMRLGTLLRVKERLSYMIEVRRVRNSTVHVNFFSEKFLLTSFLWLFQEMLFDFLSM